MNIDYTLGLRVSERQEDIGLDISLHGETIKGAGTLGGCEDETSTDNVNINTDSPGRTESKYACTAKFDDAQIYPLPLDKGETNHSDDVQPF